MRQGRHARRTAVIVAVLVAVFLIDQGTKAWAWRHSLDARINDGGSMLVSGTLGGWFEHPVIGGLLDLVDLVLLGALVVQLRRHVHQLSVLAPAALVLAGWTSNLSDRLGMHLLTAPDSERGVVDFLPALGYTWNLADLAIGLGAVWLALALIPVGVRRLLAPARRIDRRRGLAIAGVVAAVLLVTVGTATTVGATLPEQVLAAQQSIH